MTRSLSTLFVIAFSIPLFAQGDTGYSASTKKNWNEVKRNLAESATLMPERGYAFRPTADVRTFGQILGHVANEHYAMCSQATGKPNPQERADFEAVKAKADLVKALNESIAFCDAAYAALKDEPAAVAPLRTGGSDSRFSVLAFNVVHDNEHYGNLVTYLRMNKLVPPSTARFSR